MIIEWDNKQYELGLDIMDDTHREFVEQVNQLVEAPDNIFPALFQNFISHTQLHFQLEESLMDDSNFPAASEHKSEHLRVLGELNRFKRSVDKGLITFARKYIKSGLPEWFKLHAGTMDSALAAHVKSGDTELSSQIETA